MRVVTWNVNSLRARLERVEECQLALAPIRSGVVDPVQRLRHGGRLARDDARGECFGIVDRHAAPFASATTSTISSMMRVRSKSFGV